MAMILVQLVLMGMLVVLLLQRSAEDALTNVSPLVFSIGPTLLS